jgi:two-component system response regulator HydG
MSERVLIVDDDKDHAESIADLLQLRGFEVEVAYSGEQALQLFRKAPFDVSIMDVKLPGMNGVDAFFEFRKVRPGPGHHDDGPERRAAHRERGR